MLKKWGNKLNILVPTDFTAISENGIKTAIDIAKQVDGKIFLMNVIFPYSGPQYSGSLEVDEAPIAESYQIINDLKKTNSERLEQLYHKYNKQHNKIETLLKINTLQDAIDQTIDEKEIDLIVIGSEGKTTVLDSIISSSSQETVRVSSCPVLTVKNLRRPFSPKNIVLALNLEDKVNGGINYVKQFAELFDCKLHLLYVITTDDIGIDTALNRLEALANKYDLKNYSINTIANSDIEEGISYFTRRKHADMISIITDGTSALSSLFLGSIAEDMVKEETYPVLTYNTKA